MIEFFPVKKAFFRLLPCRDVSEAVHASGSHWGCFVSSKHPRRLTHGVHPSHGCTTPVHGIILTRPQKIALSSNYFSPSCATGMCQKICHRRRLILGGIRKSHFGYSASVSSLGREMRPTVRGRRARFRHETFTPAQDAARIRGVLGTI
jgi:hypothetical protein